MKEERQQILTDCLLAIQSAHDALEAAYDEEEEAYDNLPEGLQSSYRGDEMQDAIDTLSEAVSTLDDVVMYLENAIADTANPDVMEIDPWQKLVVGDTVTHKAFGQGVIANIEGKYFFVNFNGRTSKFIFPDAIEKGFIRFNTKWL